MTKSAIRDFRTGTIAELAAPVSATDYSYERLSERAAYPSGGASVEATLGGILAQKTQKGRKRTGGGWKKMSLNK